MDRLRPDWAVVAFAAAAFLFHHLPQVAGLVDLHDASDLITPFGVVGAAAAALFTLRAPPQALLVAFVGAILYVDGHGIHLSANAIRENPPRGIAGERAYFWDEEFGHVWWHLGWFGLVAAIALADRGDTRLSHRQTAAIAVLLAVPLFTHTVEGGDWGLELGAAAVFAVWAGAVRRPIVTAFAAAFVLAAGLIGVWAVWQGGVPQFSELGWL